MRFGTRSVTYSSEYATDSNGNTGNNIVRYAVRYGHNSTESSITYRFTYDSLGNIVEQRMLEETVGGSGAEIMSIPEHGDFPLPGPPGPEPFDNSIATYYTYDEAGQLKKVIDGHTNITYTYSYDESGNVISSTAKKSGRVVHSYSFRYTNGLLTVFSKGNGHTLQYVNDSMGNPVQIIDGTNVKELTWGEGRALTGIFIDDDNYSTYTYNADGLRTSKTVSVHGVEETTRYVWGSNGLAGVITDDHTVVVLYDNDGEAIGFSVDGTVFTYIKNLQGDVIRVLNSDGDVVMTYSYDPWGAPITSIFSHRASSIGIPEPQENLAKYNPCTYRGYYYDQETGYYYLQSRYYDPESGRFLNADETIFLNSDGDDIISNNLFSYCGNSPTQHKDPTGYFYISLSNVKNILCMIGLNPVASVLISIGLYKLKTLVVSKCALLLAKLGAFWGPVIQAAFVFVGTIVCVPTVSDFVVAFWDCVFQGYRGISVGIKYSRWGFPYGFSVYAS